MEKWGAERLPAHCQTENKGDRTMANYVIREKESGYFWSNEDGWVDNRESATIFSEKERQTLSLPIGDSDPYWELNGDEGEGNG
jgi:hypothetical protein